MDGNLIFTDGLVNVWQGNPHILLLAGKVGHEGYFIADMIEFVERHLAEFKPFSAQKAHPLKPSL